MDKTLWAELLIEQLPADHEGRNSWLLNHGQRGEAVAIRETWATAHPEGRDAALKLLQKEKGDE